MATAKGFEKPYLDFKYKLNRMLYIGGNLYAIPSDPRWVSTPFGQVKHDDDGKVSKQQDNTKVALQHVYNMDKVHRIPLRDERPRVPKRAEGMSAAYHEKLADDAYRRAAEAKVYNDRIREEVYSHVAHGTLEIVCDPFAGDDEVEGLSDLAESIKSEQDEAKAEEERKQAEAAQQNAQADAQAQAALTDAEEKIKAKAKKAAAPAE